MFGNRRSKQFLLCTALAFAFWLNAPISQAALQDSDLDGLTDTSEASVYQTDPIKADTDNDGISDGQEVIEHTNPLDSSDSPLNQWQERSQGLIANPDSIFWYIGRASGILAFILLSIVVINGLLMTTRLAIKFLPPALNYEAHTFFSWAAVFVTLLHGSSFAFDHFIRMHWFEIFIPFTFVREQTSALGFSLQWAVGFGTLALYGILFLVITSHFKNKIIPFKIWRIFHFASFLTYLLFLMHGITAGTDSKEWWMITLYAFSFVLVFILVLIRIWISVKQKQQTIPPSV